MSISKKTIDNMLLPPEVKAELQKELIKVDQDSYLLTPKAIQILNKLNGEIINAAQLGRLNLNDRIYMNGEHITAGKTVAQIIDEHMRQSSTKIVEDEPDFEKRKVIPPESEVTFYNESRIPLEKLTMKDEYKFESWQKAMKENPDQVLEIDSLGGVTGEIKGVCLTHKQSTVKILVTEPRSLIGGTNWAKLFEDVKLIPIEDLHAGMVDRPNSSGKTLFAVSTGMALNTSVSYGVSLRSFEEREPNQPTVRTNGRQKIIDNGKRQWPEAKRRKGHRKG